MYNAIINAALVAITKLSDDTKFALTKMEYNDTMHILHMLTQAELLNEITVVQFVMANDDFVESELNNTEAETLFDLIYS